MAQGVQTFERFRVSLHKVSILCPETLHFLLLRSAQVFFGATFFYNLRYRELETASRRFICSLIFWSSRLVKFIWFKRNPSPLTTLTICWLLGLLRCMYAKSVSIALLYVSLLRIKLSCEVSMLKLSVNYDVGCCWRWASCSSVSTWFWVIICNTASMRCRLQVSIRLVAAQVQKRSRHCLFCRFWRLMDYRSGRLVFCP